MLQSDGAIHVLEGLESQFQPSSGDGSLQVEPDAVRVKFKKFVKEFMYTPDGGNVHIGTLKYRDQFQQNCDQGVYKLEVNLNDLASGAHEDGEQLAECLWRLPSTFLPLCEKALQELYVEHTKSDGAEGGDLKQTPQVQLLLKCDVDLEGTFGTRKPTMLRELKSDRVEELVVVQGIVVSAKPAYHKARTVVLRCSNCENIKKVFVGAGHCAAHIPSACDGNALAGQMEKCPPNPFLVVDDLCEFVDEQKLKLQELPEHVPVGEMPRSVDLVVHQYLVDQCTPGTRLTAIGVYTATEREAGDKMGGSKGKGTQTVKYSYLQINGLSVSQGNMAEMGVVNITNDEQEHFERLSKEPGIRDKIYRSIAPAICASSKDVIDDVKKAVACLLFGGSRKQLPDGTRMRGDINCLLLGDPGTAKSQFLKFAEKVAPIAVYTSGKGSSAAGLTAAITKDANGFALEGGAMVLADGGVVLIDEFDKMDSKDRVAIHEAMEQQTISIAKAGITTMLNTRCSVLAAANPKFGTYDDLASTSEQMDFETTILSRFDMMFLVRDVRDPERDYNLAKHLASLHKGEIQQEKEGDISVLELRKYLSYCRSRCAPRISAEAGEVLKNHYISIRANMKRDKDAGRDSGIPITVRQLEAIIRISEALAKMEMTDNVDITHVEEALRLFTVSTLDSANKDRALAGEQLTEEDKSDLHKAEEQVRRRVARGARIGKFDLQNWLISNGGIDERLARRAIHTMIRTGELVERTNMTLMRPA